METRDPDKVYGENPRDMILNLKEKRRRERGNTMIMLRLTHIEDFYLAVFTQAFIVHQHPHTLLSDDLAEGRAIYRDWGDEYALYAYDMERFWRVLMSPFANRTHDEFYNEMYDLAVDTLNQIDGKFADTYLEATEPTPLGLQVFEQFKAEVAAGQYPMAYAPLGYDTATVRLFTDFLAGSFPLLRHATNSTLTFRLQVSTIARSISSTPGRYVFV